MNDGFAFSCTGYTDHAEAVLAFRNRCRILAQTRAYLDWRYLGEKSPLPPKIFWLHDHAGRPAAMVALVSRGYVLDGEPQWFAVLGDIGVAPEFRRRGLSVRLFENIGSHIECEKIPHSFVLPNRAAERGLARAGWSKLGEIATMVRVINGTQKFQKIVRSRRLARALAALMRRTAGARLRRRQNPKLRMETALDFDADFDAFWEAFPKRGLVLRSHSRATLRWRYREQPGADFLIGKFFVRDEFAGFAVWELVGGSHCILQEFLVANAAWLEPALAHFLLHTLHDARIETVRILLNLHHPYLPHFRRLGFVRRGGTTAFQAYQSSLPRDSAGWLMMPGDKDA